MESIQIKNFGGIKEMTMEISKINILIGPQASGKSVTAKLIYFFKKVPSTILSHIELGDSNSELPHLLNDRFLGYFPQETWPKDPFSITYINGKGKITVKNTAKQSFPSIEFNEAFLEGIQKSTIAFNENDEPKDTLTSNAFQSKRRQYDKFYNAFQASISENTGYSQFFIPAGRSFFAQIQSSIFSILNNKQSLDPLLIEFGSLYENMREIGIDKEALLHDSEVIMNDILNGALVRKEKKDWIYHNDGRVVNLSKASSGQQEVTPLLYLLAFFPVATFTNGGATVFIEEPEAHLFPNAQRKIVQLLVRLSNDYKTNFELFITTHSPYILSSFNNLMEAGKIAKEQPEKKDAIKKVVPEEEWLNPDDVNAYSITAGKLESLIDKETKLISQNHLDSVSDDLAIDFGKLLDIEY